MTEPRIKPRGMLFGQEQWQTVRDPHAGDSLVARGILLRPYKGSSRMYFSEAALVRALRVAIDAALEDLIANDPPPIPAIDLREDLYGDEGPHKLILLDGEIAVR